jgi:hypothetical protein
MRFSFVAFIVLCNWVGSSNVGISTLSKTFTALSLEAAQVSSCLRRVKFGNTERSHAIFTIGFDFLDDFASRVFVIDELVKENAFLWQRSRSNCSLVVQDKSFDFLWKSIIKATKALRSVSLTARRQSKNHHVCFVLFPKFCLVNLSYSSQV